VVIGLVDLEDILGLESPQRAAVGIDGHAVHTGDDFLRFDDFTRPERPVGGDELRGVDDAERGRDDGVQVGDALIEMGERKAP
jgi:hypothetical protein